MQVSKFYLKNQLLHFLKAIKVKNPTAMSKTKATKARTTFFKRKSPKN